MGGILPELVIEPNISRVRSARIFKFYLDKKKYGKDSKEV